MICCDLCNDWFHGDCVAVGEGDHVCEYCCPSCVTQSGKSTPLSVDVHGEPCENFVWGDVDGLNFSRLVNDAYEEVVHWRRNIF